MTPSMDRSLKSLHDSLMAEKPDDAVHDVSVCPFCADGGTSMTTYTEDELTEAVKAAVDKATTELRSKVVSLEAAQQSTEVQEAVATAIAAHEAELAALQAEKAEIATKLDEAVITAESERQRADQLLAWLEGEATAEAGRIATETRKEARLAAVKEVACFPDEYLETNAQRFAAMSDEDFEAALESYKAITAAKGGTPAGDLIPSVTGLHASRDDNGSKGTGALKGFMAQRRLGRTDFSSL